MGAELFYTDARTNRRKDMTKVIADFAILRPRLKMNDLEIGYGLTFAGLLDP